jgi:hypothetical protein
MLPIPLPKYNMNLLVILLLCFNIISSPVYAAETTPSTVSDKVEDVKDIIKQIVKDTSTETKIITNDPKSFFGTITQINDNQIVINSQNQNKVFQISSETAFVDAKRLKSKLASFKVGQTILAMGYINQDQSINCKRIVATELKTVENTNQIVTGQIVDVSQSQTSPIFVLIPSQNKNSQYQVKTDLKTEIIDPKNNKLTLSKTILTGKKIIAIIQPDAKLAQTFYAFKIISLDSNPLTP